MEHLNEFESLTINLSSIKQNMDDGMQAMILLRSLFESWNPSIISSTDLTLDGKVTMSMVKNSPFNKETHSKYVVDTNI